MKSLCLHLTALSVSGPFPGAERAAAVDDFPAQAGPVTADEAEAVGVDADELGEVLSVLAGCEGNFVDELAPFVRGMPFAGALHVSRPPLLAFGIASPHCP